MTLRRVVTLLGLISLVAAAAFAYGWSNASKERTYAQKTHRSISTLLSRFESAEKLLVERDNPAALRAVSNDASAIAADLASAPTPSRSDRLRRDAIELIELVGGVAQQLEATGRYVSVLSRVSEETKFDGHLGENQDIATGLASAERSARKSVAELEIMVPPDSFSAKHEELLSFLLDYADALATAAQTLEAASPTRTLRSLEEAATSAQRLVDLDPPARREVLEEVFPLDDRKKMLQLADRIDRESSRATSRVVLF